jgi:hypothetical protein
MRQNLVEKRPKNPNNKDNRAQNFNDHDLGVAKEAVKVETLFAAGLKIKLKLRHAFLYSARHE